MIESLLYTLALCLTGGMAAVFSDKYQKEREKNRELMDQLAGEQRSIKKLETIIDMISEDFKKSEGAK